MHACWLLLVFFIITQFYILLLIQFSFPFAIESWSWYEIQKCIHYTHIRLIWLHILHIVAHATCLMCNCCLFCCINLSIKIYFYIFKNEKEKEKCSCSRSFFFVKSFRYREKWNEEEEKNRTNLWKKKRQRL